LSEDGKVLRLEHAHADLKMDLGNVRRAWRELQEEGRVRRVDGRLCVCGAVELPAIGEQKAQEVCTDLFAPYILKQLKKLDPETRRAFEARYAQEDTAERKALAGAVAAVRCIFDK